jgi:hypothetical protein
MTEKVESAHFDRRMGLRQILVQSLQETLDSDPFLTATALGADTRGFENMSIHGPPPVPL